MRASCSSRCTAWVPTAPTCRRCCSCRSCCIARSSALAGYVPRPEWAASRDGIPSSARARAGRARCSNAARRGARRAPRGVRRASRGGARSAAARRRAGVGRAARLDARGPLPALPGARWTPSPCLPSTTVAIRINLGGRERRGRVALARLRRALRRAGAARRRLPRSAQRRAGRRQGRAAGAPRPAGRRRDTQADLIVHLARRAAGLRASAPRPASGPRPIGARRTHRRPRHRLLRGAGRAARRLRRSAAPSTWCRRCSSCAGWPPTGSAARVWCRSSCEAETR